MDFPDPVPYLSDLSGKEHNLANAISTIGRGVENDIVIVSKRVSREHARIRREGRKVFLEDLDSTNGTFLNDQRVLSAAVLRDGDRILIGDAAFQFHDPDTTTRESPFPDLDVDREAGVVRLDRSPIALSPKEFTLLTYLYDHRGKVCSKEEIGQAVWAEYEQGVYDYQIENLVRRLRTKIERDPNAPLVLLTVRGMGYRLVA